MKRNFLALLLLLGTVFFFLYPTWSQRVGIFLDDVSTYAYPNAVFQSKCLKEFIFPFWEPHTFMGACPFYLRIDAAPFYLLQMITGFFASLRTATSAYRTLLLWPIVIHYLIAASGAYFLARVWLGLNRTGALVMGLFYALSASLLGGMLNPPFLYSQSWFPWLIAPIVLYCEKGGGRYLLAGAVMIALFAPIWPVLTFHGLFISGLLGGGVLARRFIRRGTGKIIIQKILGLSLMLAIGTLLSSPFWFSLFEGTRYIKVFYPLDFDFITAGPRSVPPAYWLTLFVPELFNTVNFSELWGPALNNELWLCEAYLTKGFWLFLPGFWALVILTRGKIVDPELRFWGWFGAAMIILGLLLMTGRHTPIFNFFYRVCPLFRLPYASRWHTVYTFGLALTAGIGSSLLASSRRETLSSSVGTILTYGAAVTAGSVSVFLVCFSGGRDRPEWGWFLGGPVLYLIASLLILIAICFFRRFRVFPFLLVFLAVVDLLWFGARFAYSPMGITWETEQRPVAGPAASMLFQRGEAALERKSGEGYRTGFFRSHYDNSALVDGDYSFLGVATKPMLPRVMELLREICRGFPYQLTVVDFSTRFPANFSVRDWWLDTPVSPRPDWAPDPSPGGGGLYHYVDASALPRVYTQDNWRTGVAAEEKTAVLRGDLKAGLICSPDASPFQPPPGGGRPERFSELQRLNRINPTAGESPNRITLSVRIDQPAWLVLADAWHPGWQARVNGKPVPVRRVNYCQKGIWLERGEHNIMMEFRPVWWPLAARLSLGGVLAFFFLGIRSWRSRSKSKRREPPRDSTEFAPGRVE